MARRGRATRQMRESRPVVIGAGVTEKWYFLHLKKLCGFRVEVKPKYFGSDTAFDMQKWVEDTLAAGDKAICVYDMDTTLWDETERFLSKYSWVENLLADGQMQRAIDNAEALGRKGESYTTMPEVIHILEKFPNRS